jgi:hypothetical protein
MHARAHALALTRRRTAAARSWRSAAPPPPRALHVLSPPPPARGGGHVSATSSSSSSSTLRALLSAKYAERETLEAARLARPLHGLHDFPLLHACLALTGLLPTPSCAGSATSAAAAGPGAPLLQRRATRAAAYALLATCPYLPGLLLPACAPHCDAAAGGAGCGSCVTTFSPGRLLLDALFTAALLSEGPQLAHTLHDVYRASHLSKRAIQAFARPACRAFLALFAALWVVLPTLDVLSSAAVARRRAAGGPSAYSVSRGDLATRALWVAAGPARAALMTGVMTGARARARLAHSQCHARECLTFTRDVV